MPDVGAPTCRRPSGQLRWLSYSACSVVALHVPEWPEIGACAEPVDEAGIHVRSADEGAQEFASGRRVKLAEREDCEPALPDELSESARLLREAPTAAPRTSAPSQILERA